jgi:hypothetical protein
VPITPPPLIPINPGDNATVTMTTYNQSEVPLYFRGARNLRAVISYLVASYGLGSASEVIVSGDSAGTPCAHL